MPGLSTLSPVTPFRKTHVVFDSAEQVLVQPAVSFERTANQMARSTFANRTNVSLKEGIGWRVSNYADVNYFLDERTTAQDNYLTVGGGTLSVSSSATEAKRTRKILNAEVTGIDTGSSSDLATTSAPYYRRLWADTDNVSTLGMSTAGFNQPDTTDTSYVMDRIAESVNQYNAGDDFFFVFDVPGTKHATPQAIGSFYFPGPSSQTRLLTKSIAASVTETYETGRGEYCLKLYGDGQAVLFERLTTGSPYTWKARTSFQFAASGAVFGASHHFNISQSIVASQDGGKAGTIAFRMGNASHIYGGFTARQASIVAAGVQSQDQKLGHSSTYKVPNASGTPVSANPCNLRVDIRRDLRGIEFCLGVTKYVATGTLQCDKFKHGGLSITTGVSTDHPYVLQWDADIPSAGSGGTGATVDLKLYSSVTNAEISTPVVVSVNTKNYPLPATFTDSLYVVATLTASTSKTKSPTLRSWKVYRDALSSTTTTTETDFVTDSSGGSTVLTRVISEFSMTGAERDASHEMASIKGADLLGTYTPLRLRSGIPVSVWTEYDPADATKKFYLFDGYINPTDTIPIPGNGHYRIPTADAYMFDLQANGKWQRLKEVNFTVVQQFFLDGDGQPFKVSDLVKYMFNWCGFDSTQYDVPDSPIRINGKGGDPLFSNSPIVNLLDSIQDLLQTYLGWFLVWDRNAGTSGVWRILPQVRAPYTNVAAFTMGGPPQVDGSSRMTHNVKSYPLASTLADGFTYTATAPVIPISSGTIKDQVIPPEGNLLYVSTIHTGENPDGAGDASTVVLFNKDSFDFDPINPTANTSSADYLGRCVPIYYFMPSLVAAGDSVGPALHRIARRIYDYSCHAIYRRDFEVPIVEIKNDYDATRVRNLRYYDPVTVDGVQYIVRNVNPHYTKDGVQTQMIQVEKPNF